MTDRLERQLHDIEAFRPPDQWTQIVANARERPSDPMKICSPSRASLGARRGPKGSSSRPRSS